MKENDMSPIPTRDSLRDSVAQLLGIPAGEITDDANLAHLGLKSLQLMQLVNQWRRAGLTVTFRELAADPTIEGWSERLGEGPPG
jgi:aryl carrier-like protein